MSANLKVFIGWDSREDIAYQVAKYSILKHNPNIEVYPIKLDEMRKQGLYTRDDDKKGSTEFTISRFLVPYLSNYEGYSLFIDCDMVCLRDLEFVLEFADDDKDVYCVQHHYDPKSMVKMDGKEQHIYPRKNWSSVMLFDNKNCTALTPEIVNTETPMYLHRMMWTEDRRIGKLPPKFNFLAGYYDYEKENPVLIHYTDGGPWFKEYHNCPHSDLWKNEIKEMFGIE
tara:strand:- start:129 stop:809 length:681 start_codon:yes stop_codon:yes gene_type:complete